MSNLKVNRDFNPIEFQEVKEQLKEFLKQQDEFKDYNFEGSNISVLLDVMAYSIHYLLFYLNMTINEFFLEYTSIKDNAITLAKSLGYQPRRKKSSTGKIRILPEGVTPSEGKIITVPMYTRLNYNDLEFVTMEDIQISYIGGEWIIPEVTIKQGILRDLVYTAETNSPTTTINENADEIENSFLFVRVGDETWVQNTEIPDYIDSSSRIYFLTRIANKLKISFGDGILGRQVTPGNLIRIFYLLSAGSNGNIENVQLDILGNLSDNQGNIYQPSNFTVITTQAISGGSDEETLESIKVNAPKAFSAQDRAITKDDFDVIIDREGYNANVWGGNEEFDIYSIPAISSIDYALLNLNEKGKTDFFVGGLQPPYFTPEISENVTNNPLAAGFYCSEVNDDMIWQLQNPMVGEDTLPAPLEDVTYTYWQLTHKPKIGYIYFCGFNVDANGNKIQYNQNEVNNFKTFLTRYKPITLKLLPFKPNIISYDFDIRIKRDPLFIGNTQELLNKLKLQVKDYFNEYFVGFNTEFVKSQIVDLVMSDVDIRYCVVNYKTKTRIFKPYLNTERMNLRLYNEIKPGSIRIVNNEDEVIAWDNGSGKIVKYIPDPSDPSSQIEQVIHSRIDYLNGSIEFMLGEGLEELDMDFGTSIDIKENYMHFEFTDTEYQNIKKENYINDILEVGMIYA
jgi:hypothetical protein